jgi:hypothetical protein
MKILIPNKEKINPLTIKQIELVGCIKNESGFPQTVFKLDPSISEITNNEFFEIDDKDITNIEYIQFKYIHSDITHMVIWNNPKHPKNTINKPTVNYAAYIPPTIIEDGFIEAELRKAEGWKEVFPKETYINKATYYNLEILSEEKKEKLLSPIEIDSTGILTLKNGIVSNRGLVYSEDMKERYIELTRFNNIEFLQKNEEEISMYNQCRFDKKCVTNVDYIGGKCLNLFPLFSNNNYCHSVLDFSAMLNMTKKYEIDINNFDWYVILENNFRIVKDLLKNIKIPKYKILYTGLKTVNKEYNISTKNMMFDELISPSLDCVFDWYRPDCFQYIRKMFLNSEVKPTKKSRLYLTRENSGRNLSNIKEFENLIDRYGFEPIDCSYQYNLPTIMSEASVVIGAHGAAMANCVFCSPESILIDLMPEFYSKTYFSSLAQGVGMQYIGVICKENSKIGETSTGIGPHSNRSFEVDIPLLKSILDKILL